MTSTDAHSRMHIDVRLNPSFLATWYPRDAVLHFLDASTEVPVADRVAFFDNDGTLWCERPNYAQLDFFISGLKKRLVFLQYGEPSCWYSH